MTNTFGLIIVIGLALIVVLVVLTLSGRGVDRAWLDRFAARQRLVVTAGNGDLVARSLAVIHRWRRFGLLMGFLLAAAWAIGQGRIQIDFVAMFLGWFAGSLVAEWRIGTPTGGTRHRADLSVRTIGSYVSAANRSLLWTVAALLVASAAFAGVIAFTGGSSSDWLVALAQSVVGAVAVWAVVQRVVGRQRPSEPEDVREADDALRGNSLTTITGSAIAVAALPLSGFASIVLSRVAVPEIATLVPLLILLAGIALGWYVASVSTSVRAARP